MNYEMELNGSNIQIMLEQGREKPRVGFLGPAGTYTEEATERILNSQMGKFDISYLSTNGEVVRRVDVGDYDIGIVPVENSTEGDVMDVLRALVHTHRLSMLGETILRIEHVLIGRNNQPIQEVYSHVQALGQCRAFLLSNYPGAIQISTPSTAAGVAQLKDKPNAAAIASRRAAEISGFPILADNIGDVKDNSTRFVLLGRGKTNPTNDPDKKDSTTLVFVPKEDRAGILARCLTALASYGINLTKIDSHPTGIMRAYMFLLTLDGHQQDPVVRAAIEDLRATYCASLKILGSYRKAEVPEGTKEPGFLNGS